MKRAAAALLLVPALMSPPAFAQADDAQRERDDGEDRARGRMVLRVESGIDDRGRTYVARGQRVTLRGAVSEYAPEQFVAVTVTRGGRELDSRRLLIRKDGDVGRFTYRFTARRSGRYLIRAYHAPTPQQAELFQRALQETAVTAARWKSSACWGVGAW